MTPTEKSLMRVCVRELYSLSRTIDDAAFNMPRDDQDDMTDEAMSLMEEAQKVAAAAKAIEGMAK